MPDPGAGKPKPDFHNDASGSTIAGIHAGVVQLKDGCLLALGRGDNRLGSDDNIGERMPQSISCDMGLTWKHSASPFAPIDGGQRLVLIRLREGALLLVSFTDYGRGERCGMFFKDKNGNEFRGWGMFAALSFDEGLSWPVRKLLTPGPGKFDGGAWTDEFQTDAAHAEPRGYLSATQTPDGIIHLVSSGLYYRFNVAWLTQPATKISP